MKAPLTSVILAAALPMFALAETATPDALQVTQSPGQNTINYNGGDNEYSVAVVGYGATVNYAWSVDGALVDAATGHAFTNKWTLAQAGAHTVSCDISDAESNLLHSATWNVTVKRRLYVSASSTASSPTGANEATAFKNLYDAYMSSRSGDTIWVLPGSYVSFWLEDDRRITIESSAGARQTTIFSQYEEDPICFYGYGTNITTIAGFTFSGGGAASTTLKNCIVTGCKPNSYGYWGGPNYLDGARLENCLLTGNRVTCLVQSATLINCTVVDNEVVEAEEMYYYYGDIPFGIVGPYANIYNSIVRFNYDAEGNEVNLANISADLYGSSAQPKFYSSCTYPRPAVSTNVITDDPCFADAVFGDYRLYKDSPCIEAGDNSFASAEKDLDGNDRIIGETVDMGCYEGGVSFPIPATPSNVTVGNGVAADGCIVKWDAVPGAREYVVYRSDNNTPAKAIAVATVAETIAEDVSSSTNVQYWYFVQARNESGASEMSAGASGWRVPSLEITSTTPNPVVAGNPISIAMSATGGQSPYTWHPCTNAYDFTKTEGSYSFAKGSTTGVGLTSSDSSLKEYSLPFDFPFGGKKYSTLYISPYGAVLFGEKPNYFYPEEFKNYKLIAPLLGWSGDYGDVYIENSTTHEITFRWQYGYSGYESNFSLTLTETGVARMSYGTRNDYAYGAVVGISFGDNTNYIYEPSRGVVPTDHDVIFSPNVMPDGIALSSDGTIAGKLTQVGDYSFLVSVKDALNNVRDELVTLTVVDNPNLHPVVTDLQPSHNTVIVRPDADNVFAVEASDPEGEPITWTWLIDGATNCVTTTPEFRYRPNEQFGGVHTLTCLVSDGFWVDRVNKKWNIVVPKWYVSPSGSSSNSGNCFANVFASIQTAIDRASDGDVIYVGEGVYPPISTSNKSITILAAQDASVVIDGNRNGRCVNVGNGTSYTNTVFNGITIRNGYVAGNGAGALGGTFKNCILCENRSYNGYYGGGVAYGTLYNCQINDNYAVLGAGGAYNATLYNCTVVGNSSRQNAGLSNCTRYNTICWGNTLDDGLTPNGNDNTDPELVKDENGIYRLSSKSPHIDAGASVARTSTDLAGGARVQGSAVDLGAVEGVANGLYVKTVLNGAGKTSASVVVSEGGKCILTATQLDEEHRFLGFYADGIQLSDVASSGLVHQVEFSPTDEETIVTVQFETRTFYVATDGEDANDARSWETARRTIRGALRSARSGDTVLVADGMYEPFSITSNHPIAIRSVNGYRATVIDGGFTNACAVLGYDTSCRNTTLEGFTLQRGTATNGGGASYGTLRYCYITNNRASSYGGGVYNVNAENCILWKNTANNGGGAANSLLMSCTVYGNSCSNSGGGIYQGIQHNTIIVGNAPNNCYSGSQYSCYQSNNPMFVYQEDGDFRLREGSPCLNAGNIGNARGGTDVLGTPRIQDDKLDIGACEGAYPGFVIGTKTVGHGDVEPRYMLLAQGQDAYFTALEQERPFIGFSTNGVDILEPTTNYVWQNVFADGTLYVHFKTNIFVNAAMPDDSGDGLTPETAKRTLQAAATMAKTGEVIRVADGDYEPVNTSNKPIRFESEGGWERTVIDGGGTNRCVYVGEGSGYTATKFYGFTIRNGRIINGYGGGSSGGEFFNCVFENNASTGNYGGGGSYYANLYNCLVSNNSAYNGGGTYGGVIANCTIVENEARSYGGGTYSCDIRNTIVWDNISGGNERSNTCNSVSIRYSCVAPAAAGTDNICSNPYFADPKGGDYRLQQYSPCLDVGNNSYMAGETDLAGTNRVIDATVDMGAYEGWVYLPVPGVVEGLSAEDGTRIGLVRLTWTGVEYARNYSIQRSVTESFEEYEVIGTTGSNFFDDETATPETNYWYRVVGVNPAGEGPASAADSGWCLGEMTFGASELPTAVAGLAYNTKLGISGGSGNYVWKTGADDYDVVYGESTYLVSDHVSTGVSGDDNCLSYPLPFDFPFYGKSYNKVWVNSNGTINFDGSYNGYSADEATFKSKAIIAVLWKDLRTGSGGVGVSTNGNESITFLWNGATYYSGGAAVNVSVTLYSDGTILCSYGNGNASGGFVGVSAGDGTHYRNLGLNGTSLANADDIRFVPQDVPAGLTLAADGTLSGTASAPGTYTFTVFVTDSYGNGATQKVTLEVEENPNMRTVQFDLGEYGVRGGGGALLQYVLLGESATAPTVRPMLGWVFNGWGGSFTEISDNVLVPATYRSAYADLHVDSIDFVNEIASDESLVVNWTVGNTGNPAFNGNMTEKISLVSTVDESVKIEIANPTFVGSILRDGAIARAATIRIPLKGCEGSWRVQIETAIRPSVREYDINNITVSEDTLEITATPLPDLSVKSIALDLDPAEYMPLDTVTVHYVVQNTGTGAAKAPWRDRLYLCKNGTRVNLATLDETEDIAAGAEVERTIQCAIPELVALSGDVSFVVKADCDDSVVELADDDAAENAAWEATPNATLGKRLYLTFAAPSVNENNSGGVRFYAKRSGETDKALVLSLTAAGATSDVTFPTEITIGIGSSTATGYIKPIDNTIVDGTRTVAFTLVPLEGADFASAFSSLTIVDNEVPKLTMSFDKTSIKEGDGTILVTLTRELVTSDALVVYVTGSSMSRVAYPTTVTIPPNEQSVTFEISVPNNDVSQITSQISLYASAAGHEEAAGVFEVEDDDVPGVILDVSPAEVSENAGAYAAYATLTRADTSKIGTPITVHLSANDNGSLILPYTVTIPRYTMASRFAIGVVDNSEVDGDRVIEINGTIVIDSCGCDGQPSTGGAIYFELLVHDDDGPALMLTTSQASMKEGLIEAGFLTISHNTTSDKDIVVYLSHDSTGEISIPDTVVIPAGQKSITVPVATLDDGVTDGNKLISVYADADDFASSATWIQVSDQNLPDIIVQDITTPLSAVGDSSVEIEFTLSNVGFSDCPPGMTYSVHYGYGNSNATGKESLIATGLLQESIPAGGAVRISEYVKLPVVPGDGHIGIAVDPDNVLAELDKVNNIAWGSTITIAPQYIANVQLIEHVFRQNTPIVINGQAFISNAASVASNVEVDVYVLNAGYRRTLKATTDADGKFSVTFHPLSGEFGDYSVGASYPNFGSTLVQDTFSILGMNRIDGGNVIFDLHNGESTSRTIVIKNKTSVPLSGISVAVSDKPDTAQIGWSASDAVDGNGNLLLRLDVSANGVTKGSKTAYEKFYIVIKTVEGAEYSFPCYYLSREPEVPHGMLKFTPSALNTSMAEGRTRLIEVTLTNVGLGDTGEISVNLPSADWIRLSSGQTMTSLAAGESSSIVFELKPSDQLPLNAPITGQLSANASNSPAVALPFSITPVSENVGSIRVAPVDEYTYYLDSAPFVTNATVRITNPYTGALVASGTTGENGVWTSQNILCGTYTVSVSANQHSGWTGNIAIEPEKQTRLEPYLPFKAVSYRWEVVETEIEDAYEIKLVTDFVTSVPSPVVVIDVPEKIDELIEGAEQVFNVTLTNHGLVSAYNISLAFENGFPYSYEFMQCDLTELKAKSSITIPVRVFREPTRSTKNAGGILRADPTPPRPGELEINPCGYGLMAMFEQICPTGVRREVAQSSSIQIGVAMCNIAVILARTIADRIPTHWNGPTHDPIPGHGEGWGDEILERLSQLEEIPPGAQLANCLRGIRHINNLLGTLTPVIRDVPFGDTAGRLLGGMLYPDEVGPQDIIDALAGDLGDALGDALDDALRDGIGNALNNAADDLNLSPNVSDGVKDLANNLADFYERANSIYDESSDIRDAYEGYVDAERRYNEAINGGGALQTSDYNRRLSRSLLKKEPSAEYWEKQIQERLDILERYVEPEVVDDVGVIAVSLDLVFARRDRIQYVFGESLANSKAVPIFLEMVRQILSRHIDESLTFSTKEISVLHEYAELDGAVDVADIDAFAQRWNNTMINWSNGIYSSTGTLEGFADDMMSLELLNAINERIIMGRGVLDYRGYITIEEAVSDAIAHLSSYLEGNGGEVCARVSLSLDQKVVIARQAFEGTLTMYNGHSSRPIENIKLRLEVKDSSGVLRNDYFGIIENGLVAMEGGSILSGEVHLAASSSGSAKILFVPTPAAALVSPDTYTFGGELTYTDPFTDEQMTISLYPVALQVKPSPELTLHYFLEQEVYADDPFTANVVEPSEPTELSLLICNNGAGEVRQMTVHSAQPEVFKSSNGLSVDFSIADNFSYAATRINGESSAGTIEVAVGNIQPYSTAQAQWWLTSTIQGRFTGMKAEYTQLNDWGNPDTCLINAVNMHKLVRSVYANDNGLPDFLTADNSPDGHADSIWLDNGHCIDVERVALVASEIQHGDTTFFNLSINTEAEGACYGLAVDPGNGNYVIDRIEREDGTIVNSRNYWLRDRTIAETGSPIYGHRLHFFDVVSRGGTHQYRVWLSPKDQTPLVVDAFEDVVNGTIETDIRNSIYVRFSKPIFSSSFGVEDLQLIKQEIYIEDISSLTVEPSDETGTRFTISGLAALCGDLGRYELVVQCAGIADLSGQYGTSGKAVAWTLSTPDSPYILDAEGRPTKRVRRMNGVTTVTSIPVTEESARNLVVTLNGTDVSQFVTIRPVDETGTRFAIEGLDELQLADGDYTLVIDGGNLVGLDGGSGIESYTVTWTRDTVAPVLNGVRRETGLNGTSFVLELSEDADPETISLANVMLTRKASRSLNAAKHGLLGAAPAGETEITLPATARLTALGNGGYTVTGIDSAILEDGTYTLYFDAAGVADEAGNEVSGVKSVTWTVDSTAPDAVSDIAVSSEYGSVDSVVYTSSRELTVSGTVPEVGLTVEIFSKYVGGSETLLAEPVVDGNLRFTADLTLPGDGNLTIIIRLTDEYGNSSDTEFSVYVDAIALGAEITGMPEPDEAANTLTITFLNGTPDEATALAATKSLTLDGVAVAIPNVTIAKTDDARVYTVSGLGEYTAAYGTYVFTYDVREVKKASSGLAGDAAASATWVNYPIDTTPPTIAEIRFDGALPAAAYVTDQMFTEVSVRFSEAVNVPSLVAQGIAGQAFTIQFLSDDNSVVGTLLAEDIAWNASTFTASWTIDPAAVPCGKARLVVNPSLIKDASGNGLATTEAYDVISGAKTYTPSLLKSGVAYSYACPTLYDWNNDGLLDLVVGEKTEDAKGKVRIYLNRGTANAPAFNDYTYLQKDGEDVEFTAQGCVGMSISFGHARGATMILSTSQGEIYGWRHRARKVKTKEALDWELWFDHSTDARFAGLQRTQAFCYDIDGDGYDEVIVSGQNSPMFWIKRTLVNDEYVTECTPLMDATGANLQFPEGQNHTSAILTDVSGDSVPDLVTGDTAGNVWVYYGTGNARFASKPLMIYENAETSNKRSRLALGDIDGDGVEDILVGRQDGSVLLLKGEAVLAPAVNFKCVEIKSVEEALNDYIYWENGADGWTCEQFGEEAQATVTHTGDEQTTVLSAKFTGMGTVSFTWAVTGSNESSEFRCTGGNPELVKAGPFSQIAQSVTLSTPGEHLVSWVFRGRNTAIVRDVAFTPSDETLQVTQTTVVPIPFADINRFANDVWKAHGGDYEAAANATAANGRSVMENCIAGVDSSNPDAEFTAKIKVVDGVAKISWTPALNGEIDHEGVPTGIRTYTVYGTENLETPNWRLVTPENKQDMRFFRVKVQMP